METDNVNHARRFLVMSGRDRVDEEVTKGLGPMTM